LIPKINVSADRLVDSNTGEEIGLARVQPQSGGLAYLDHVDLYPGMPAEILIATDKRRAINYFLSPLQDSLARADRGLTRTAGRSTRNRVPRRVHESPVRWRTAMEVNHLDLNPAKKLFELPRPEQDGAMRHVLVVDDDTATLGLISEYLSGQDIRVSTATDSREMAWVIAETIVDLIILDLKLANEDGLKLLRELRATDDVPIIVLTGQRRDEVDRIVGLELGADDYITKPFSLRELLARIKAVLRRTEMSRAAPEQDGKGTKYRFSGWGLNLRTRRLTSPAGENVPLMKGEFSLLIAFLRSPQRVLSRNHLLSATRLYDDETFDRCIDVQILRLRRKLEADPSKPEFIRTERGAGYVFAVSVETF
jgi:two-component system, OmpR family, response regulator